MNKINKYFLMGTVALSGMVGFSACSSDDASDDNGKTPAAENGVVKAQFALNVPYGNGNTRMSANNTQENNYYRGITDMYLYSFSDDNVSVDSKFTGYFHLSPSAAPLTNDSKTQLVYRDIAIPVGTQNFVLYATATEAGETKAQIGSITRDLPSLSQSATENEISKVSAHLNPIAQSTDMTIGAPAKLAAALNTVLEASTGTGAKTWRQIAASASADDNTTTPAELQAKRMYDAFVLLKAGSARSVKAALTSLKSQADAIATSGSIFEAISKACDKALDTTEPGIGSLTFPEDLGLPDGVVSVSYEDVTENNATVKKFVYKNKSAAIFSDQNLINYADVMFPASLDYIVNTKAMVSDKLLSTISEWPAYNEWKNSKDYAAAWSGKGFEEKAVSATTRSIGLKAPIEYAVAKLDFWVSASSSLTDAGAENGDQQTLALTHADGDKIVNNFPVTGILVGDQPKSVDWRYLPNTVAGGEKQFPYTVYDSDMNNTNMALSNVTDETSAIHNYTLLLDNKVTSGDETNEVNVALELLNKSGHDFKGVNGIITNGSKFYLVGKLTLGDKTISGVANSHIFMQDYTTKAHFKVTSLRNSYNTIPDLRTSTLSLGMAVNLEWKTGLSFEVDFN